MVKVSGTQIAILTSIEKKHQTARERGDKKGRARATK